MSTAPDIAPAGVTSILSEMAPNSFGMAMDVSMSVGFDDHGERIDFSLANAGKAPSASGGADFLAILGEHQESVAQRLHDARVLSRISGEDVSVNLADLSPSPAWEALSLTAGPLRPENTDD